MDTRAVIDALAPEWLDGLEGPELAEGRTLLDEIVEDWAREADSTPDPDAVLAIQRKELAATGAGADPADRLAALRVRVLTRRVDHLSAAAFGLGRAILEGGANDPEAREEGRRLLDEAERLNARLGDDPRLHAARRKLSDAAMDALYAVERKTMSPRLARAAGDAPDVRA
jgi:hypothetical protein